MDERRALQIAVCIACLVPVGAGLAGSIMGSAFPGWLDDTQLSGGALDSHLRYLSGLLLGIGLAFLSSVPGIEQHRSRFQLLTAIVFLGGLMRLVGLVIVGVPPKGMMFGLMMELVITPALCAWQMRVAKKFATPAR